MIKIIVLTPILVVGGLFVFFLLKEAIEPTDLAMSESWAIDEGKRSLRASLKDPSSVKFDSVWAGRMQSSADKPPTLVACGYFNARNSFGGMSGRQRFISGPAGPALTDERPGGAVMDEMWRTTCKDWQPY